MKIQIIINSLQNNGVISKREAEFFTYALEETFHQMIILSSILMIGIVLHRLEETIGFSLIFPLLRKYSGGIHATNRKRCYIMTLYTYLTALITSIMVNKFVLGLMALVFSYYISQNAPAEHPNNILNLRQKSLFRKNSQKIVMCVYCIGLVSLFLNISTYSSVIFTTIILNGGNLIMQQKNKNVIKRKCYLKVLQVLTALALVVGTSSVRGACTIWLYQPEMTNCMRKYADE